MRKISQPNGRMLMIQFETQGEYVVTISNVSGKYC